MSQSPAEPAGSALKVTPRLIVGLIILALVILFIALNRDVTRVSFLFFTAETALWVALTLAGAAGFVAGLLFRRSS